MLLDKENENKLPGWVRPEHKHEIKKSIESLKNHDFKYFKSCLSSRELWRTFPEFRDSTIYLDIETTGLDFSHHLITLVGIYDGSNVRTFIRGKNLDELPDVLKKYTTIVTFNGLIFDIPFITTEFKMRKMEHIQLDLRFLLKRIGYRGGLKSIEKQLGISRTSETVDLNGFDAVRLWRQYERGNSGALNLLIKYNTEDIVNLEQLMEFAYDGLSRKTLEACNGQ